MATKKVSVFVIVGENIEDRDLKALLLINEAIRISTPRMLKQNFDFCFKSKRNKKHNLNLI